MESTNLKFLMKACIVLMCMLTCFGCNGDTDIRKEEEQKLVKPEHRWQLVTIVKDGMELTIRKNIKEGCYLCFEEDGKLKGYTGANSIEGTFTADSISGKISFQYTLTQVASLEEGVMEFEATYMELFKKITSYQYSNDSLNLYYTDSCYLKYQLIKTNRK